MMINRKQRDDDTITHILAISFKRDSETERNLNMILQDGPYKDWGDMFMNLAELAFFIIDRRKNGYKFYLREIGPNQPFVEIRQLPGPDPDIENLFRQEEETDIKLLDFVYKDDVGREKSLLSLSKDDEDNPVNEPMPDGLSQDIGSPENLLLQIDPETLLGMKISLDLSWYERIWFSFRLMVKIIFRL